MLERANRVMRQIAEAEKFDIIFQEAVYASPRIDITDKVIRRSPRASSGARRSNGRMPRRHCACTRQE